ncbi:hypothetical protein MT418_004595 [Batrachochytrium dendrobatidis]
MTTYTHDHQFQSSCKLKPLWRFASLSLAPLQTLEPALSLSPIVCLSPTISLSPLNSLHRSLYPSPPLSAPITFSDYSQHLKPQHHHLNETPQAFTSAEAAATSAAQRRMSLPVLYSQYQPQHATPRHGIFTPTDMLVYSAAKALESHQEESHTEDEVHQKPQDALTVCHEVSAPPAPPATQPNISCKECGKQFHRTCHLRSHMRIHNKNLERFHCQQCSLSFLRRHDLTRHMYIHSPIKPFSCDRCGKAFCRRDALQRHLAMDPAIRQYRCLLPEDKLKKAALVNMPTASSVA